MKGKVRNLTPIVYASQHSIYPRLWVSLSPYKDNLMGENVQEYGVKTIKSVENKYL